MLLRPEHPTRTFHILTSLDRRGAETFAVQMIDGLDRGRFAPVIWPASPPGTALPLVPQRTPVYPRSYRRGRLTGRAYYEIRDLGRALRRQQPRIIHCHGGRALKDALAARIWWKAEAYVFNKIGSVHPGLDRWSKKVVYRYLLERVDAIVAVGERVRKELLEAMPLRRPQILTINNGRDVAPFLRIDPEAVARMRQQLRLESDDVCLMAVGGLTPGKNPAFLVRLVADLLPRKPGIRLIFVGTGVLEAPLRRHVHALGLANRVTFLGVRSDVPILLSAADIVVLPSLTEGLPGVLIEGGMAGRPAVAFGVGSVEDVLDDGVTGFVVPPRDATAFRERILTLIRNPALRQEMGAAAARRCRREFAIERSVKRYEELFSTLVERQYADLPSLRFGAGTHR